NWLAVRGDANRSRFLKRDHDGTEVFAIERVELDELTSGSGDDERHERRAAALDAKRAIGGRLDFRDRIALDFSTEDVRNDFARSCRREAAHRRAADRRAVVVNDCSGDRRVRGSSEEERSEEEREESLHVFSLDVSHSANVACPCSTAMSAGDLPSLPRGSRCAPYFNRSFAISRSPRAAAVCIAV